VQKVVNNLCLFVLVVIVALRPLVGETYDSSIDSISASLSTVLPSPMPATTLIFDLVILICACLCLVTRAIGKARADKTLADKPPMAPARTGLGIGTVILVLAAIVSCYVAGQKRVAINASIDWLCYPIMAITLAYLLRRGWQQRLLLGAILASAGAQSLECFDQHFVSFPETRQQYESTKETFWSQQGVPLDDPKVALFEGRLYSNEASGFLGYSNVAGAYLLLCGFAAAGIMWHRFSTGGRVAGCTNISTALTAIGVLLIFFAMLLTRSTGAVVACGIGLVLAGGVYLGRSRWVARSNDVVDRPWRLGETTAWLRQTVPPNRAWLMGWLVAVLGGLAVVGHGLTHDSLPGASLNFRWHYWTASAGLIADHLWTGVGRENFGRHYLKYKSIQSSEEIASPHNLLVQMASEWGLIGLVGIVAMLLGASKRCVQPVVVTPQDDLRKESLPWWPWCVGVACAVFLLRIQFLGSDLNYIYSTTIILVFAWLIAFVLFTINPFSPGCMANLLSPGLVTAIRIGLLVYLVQEMIHFSLFVPGTATTAFALLALAVWSAPSLRSKGGGRINQVPSPSLFLRKGWSIHSGTPAKLIAAGACLGLLILFVTFVLPVWRSNAVLALARQDRYHVTPGKLTGQSAYRNYALAGQLDPLDPTPWAEQAQWLVGAARSIPQWRDEAMRLALDSLHQAIRKDPYQVAYYRRLARIHLELAKTEDEESNDKNAIEAYNRAVELYPNSPDGGKSRADGELQVGKDLSTRPLLRQAIES